MTYGILLTGHKEHASLFGKILKPALKTVFPEKFCSENLKNGTVENKAKAGHQGEVPKYHYLTLCTGMCQLMILRVGKVDVGCGSVAIVCVTVKQVYSV
jgi:hypothetical protein